MLVTHDAQIAQQASRIVSIRDGNGVSMSGTAAAGRAVPRRGNAMRQL